MNLHWTKLAAALGVLALAATGCSSVVATATPTPVNYKACLSASAAGVSDGSMNQNTYFGLQQAEAQFGVSISAVEAGATPSISEYGQHLKRLIERGCNLIFAVGGNQSVSVFAAAMTNPKVRFVLVDQPTLHVHTLLKPNDLANLEAIDFDASTPAFQAGYLAASHSTTKVIAAISGLNDKISQAQVWYFRQGVDYFNQANPANAVALLGASGDDPATWWNLPEAAKPESVKRMVGHLLALRSDVVFVAGVNGLAAAQAVAQQPGAVVIGSGSDWFNESRFETVKGTVLASVHKFVSDQIAWLVGQRLKEGLAAKNTPGPVSTSVISTLLGKVELSSQHKVPYGNGMQSALDDIAKEIKDGTIVLVPILK